MKVREVREEDIPQLRAMHEASGYDFEFPDLLGPGFESVQVVENDAGELLGACAAKKSIEMVLFLDRGRAHPLVKLRAIALIHSAMRRILSELGFTEANAFLPPELVKNYGRHMMRKFGWQRSWQGFTIRK